MNAQTVVAAFALVARVGRLNPAATEIGAGMLASLVADARVVLQSTDGTAPALFDDVPALLVDGLMLRQVLEISADPDTAATFADVVGGIETAEGYEPPTAAAEARARLQDAINQTNRIHGK